MKRGSTPRLNGYTANGSPVVGIERIRPRRDSPSPRAASVYPMNRTPGCMNRCLHGSAATNFRKCKVFWAPWVRRNRADRQISPVRAVKAEMFPLARLVALNRVRARTIYLETRVDWVGWVADTM